MSPGHKKKHLYRISAMFSNLDGSGYYLKQAQAPYADRWLDPDSEKVKCKQGVLDEVSSPPEGLSG